MKASNILLSYIKRTEGLRLTAYRCPAGVWTIGYGHIFGVRPGMKITSEKASALLLEDLESYERGVERLLPHLTQPQFDALVDFAFNLGLAALSQSTLLKKIKAEAPEIEIRYQFARWNKCNGKVLPGLTKRRMWEADRYFAKQ